MPNPAPNPTPERKTWLAFMTGTDREGVDCFVVLLVNSADPLAVAKKLAIEFNRAFIGGKRGVGGMSPLPPRAIILPE